MSANPQPNDASRRIRPSVNFENLSCIIRCCVPPPTLDSADGLDDDDSHEEKHEHPRSAEKDIHGSEKSGQLLVPSQALQGS